MYMYIDLYSERHIQREPCVSEIWYLTGRIKATIDNTVSDNYYQNDSKYNINADWTCAFQSVPEERSCMVLSVHVRGVRFYTCYRYHTREIPRVSHDQYFHGNKHEQIFFRRDNTIVGWWGTEYACAIGISKTSFYACVFTPQISCIVPKVSNLLLLSISYTKTFIFKWMYHIIWLF